MLGGVCLHFLINRISKKKEQEKKWMENRKREIKENSFTNANMYLHKLH